MPFFSQLFQLHIYGPDSILKKTLRDECNVSKYLSAITLIIQSLKIVFKRVAISKKIFLKTTYRLLYQQPQYNNLRLIQFTYFTLPWRENYMIKKQDDTRDFFQKKQVPVLQSRLVSLKSYIPYYIFCVYKQNLN